jgi:hypothetical protein
MSDVQEKSSRDGKKLGNRSTGIAEPLCSTSLQLLRAARRFCGTGGTPVLRLVAAAPRCVEAFEAQEAEPRQV